MTAAADHDDEETRAMALALDSLALIDRRRLGPALADARATISFGDLYAYASGVDVARVAEVEAAVARDARLAATLERLLGNLAPRRSLRLVAASTGAASERNGEGFTLRLRRSRADDRQVYVNITLDAPAETPRGLVVLGPGAKAVRRVLPPPSDGVIQFLCDAGDELVALLADTQSAIFLV